MRGAENGNSKVAMTYPVARIREFNKIIPSIKIRFLMGSYERKAHIIFTVAICMGNILNLKCSIQFEN